MKNRQAAFSARLFCSYCHADDRYRHSLEKSIALLKNEGLVKTWSDQKILPGQSISAAVDENMTKADIVVYIFSQSFIASNACMQEWNHGKQLYSTGRCLFRIPIIVEDCSWQDLLSDDDIKALPKDGKAVANFSVRSVAWQQVYEGIRDVIVQLRNTFSPRPEFIEEMQRTDFLSEEHIRLQDIFSFPSLSCYETQSEEDKLQEYIISTPANLLEQKYALVHGEEMSGKTALGRYMYLHTIQKSHPALYIDLKQVTGKPKEGIFLDFYRRQLNGDYYLWIQQKDKTLVLDNLSSVSNVVDFVTFSRQYFDRVIVTVSSDIYDAFFRDDIRLADFTILQITPLTHRQQEKLIRMRLELSGQVEHLTDGSVDQVERRVNSIIGNKIVPRFPFYVLSILQTYEGYMPSDLSVTSHGHCYYVLILAQLIKAGISRSDDDINACLNFCEHLALRIHRQPKGYPIGARDFDGFLREYRDKYIIPDSILNRLKHHEYGIITQEGRFKTSYMYYFFLGRFLSKNHDEYQSIIQTISAACHIASNYLTLLFIIHHTDDDRVIDDVLIQVMCTLDTVKPALLVPSETKLFNDIISGLPESILSNDSVEEERERERKLRDLNDVDMEEKDLTESHDSEDPVNDIYRILKTNGILGQILRNKYGSLKKDRIAEIVVVTADSGLRLINFAFRDEKEIIDYALYIHKKYPKEDLVRIKRILKYISFLWTMINVEKIVSAINHPEIGSVVREVVYEQSTPAYDLIGYFSRLDSATELHEGIAKHLGELLKRHNDPFIRRVLSLRTQHYMNTHTRKGPIEQSICSLLDIKYVSRLGRRN